VAEGFGDMIRNVGQSFMSQGAKKFVDLLDAGELPVAIAVRISQMSPEKQADIRKAMDHYLKTNSHPKLQRLRDMISKQGVAEGSSCNMTMEGDYCPEHGLMECGMHEGAFHNPEQTDSPAAQAITRRILLQRTDLLSKYGPEKVGQAIDEVADFIGDVEEIGSSDVSGWVRHVEQMLGNMGDDVAEAMRNTDDPYDDMVEDYLDYLESVGMLDKSREQEKAEILASLEAGHLHSSEIEYALSGTKWDPLAPHGMAEANDDPINYNGAITGSYYESKQDPLARIKSLALRK
jgi:DNA-directed RNA polymerase subunit F